MPDEVTLRTSDDVAIEAEVAVPAGATVAAVLLHPHPLHGGSMHTPVPETLFDALPRAGAACLRLNFRGVGRSAGSHDRGRAEAEDVRAGVAALTAAAPDVPVWIVGYSFGADVGLSVADDGVAGWVGVAPPLALIDPDTVDAGSDPRPKALFVPEHDQFSGPDRARAKTSGWTETTVEVVDGTDHFLMGRLSALAERVAARIVPPA